MKIRVTIDTDVVDDNVSDMGSLERGVYGCDNEGLYHLYYGNRSDLVTFEDVEILDDDRTPEQKHDADCSECKAEWEKQICG